jgi:FkbM family methyltransferase
MSLLKNLLKGALRYFDREIRPIDSPAKSTQRGLEILAQFTPPPQTIIDIGVADGTPELYAQYSQKKFLLVEANPQYKETLQNLVENINAELEMVFCGAEEGTEILQLYKDGRKASKHVKRDEQPLDNVSVPVKRLDDLIVKHKFLPPYLVKIDVEGAELEVLKGAEHILPDAVAVIVETSVAPRFDDQPTFAEVVWFMHQHGFALFDIWDGAIKYNRLLHLDLVFTPSQTR